MNKEVFATLFGIATLITIALIGQKLDGNLHWPWISWNPIEGCVFIVVVWAIYIIAAAVAFIVVGLSLKALGSAILKASNKAKVKEQERYAEALDRIRRER